MKRLSYMACLLLASAAFTACDEDFKDWADPQSNPQEEAITAMVDITPVASMKLEEQPGDSVVIASVSSIAENFSLTACNIELVAEGQILNLPSKVKDGNIKVRLTELDQKVASLYKSQKSLECVRPRTSKGITDLLLPQTSIGLKPIVPLRSG